MLQIYSFLYLSILAGAVPLTGNTTTRTGTTLSANLSLEVDATNNSIVVEITFSESNNPQAMLPNSTTTSPDLRSRAGDTESTVIGESSGVTSIATVRSNVAPSTSSVFVSASAAQTSVNLPSLSLSNAGTASHSGSQTSQPFSPSSPSNAESTAPALSVSLSGSSSDTVSSRSSSKAESASHNKSCISLPSNSAPCQSVRFYKVAACSITDINANSKQASDQHIERACANMCAVYLCERWKLN
ncbi:hypothetical protein R3P38DRAFT_2793597 [Favolaschia claudopus]|uniref:Uncharacterized protein n=1 Tax=Favolaschia claudopus TaxID=2862362 RepID=A0AAW0ADI4_9AGAR